MDHSSDAKSALRDVARWRAGLSPAALVSRELAQFERWRATPPSASRPWLSAIYGGRARPCCASRKAATGPTARTGRYGNGLIVAALPDVYFTPWVRDMAWATVALARMGHRAEARAALLAYFNARPTGKMRAQVNNADYQISVVRYFGDGAEAPFFTQEGATNIEFDDWGEALWALGEYLRRYDDPRLLRAATHRGPLYESARDFIVSPLLANTEPYGDGRIVAADTSIWEERQKDAKHFAFSTAMAIVGLREFAEVAAKGQRRARAPQRPRPGRPASARLRRRLHPRRPASRNARARHQERYRRRAIADHQLRPRPRPAVVRDTLDRMELLKVASGGYRRVRGTYTDPKIFEYWYEQEEFLFVATAVDEVPGPLSSASASCSSYGSNLSTTCYGCGR